MQITEYSGMMLIRVHSMDVNLGTILLSSVCLFPAYVVKGKAYLHGFPCFLACIVKGEAEGLSPAHGRCPLLFSR